jgi:hypothetical protein
MAASAVVSVPLAISRPRGLPPILIQVGSHEILLSDAIQLTGKAAKDDVAIPLEVVPGVSHVFQAFAALLHEGAAALNRAAEFLREQFPVDWRSRTGDRRQGHSEIRQCPDVLSSEGRPHGGLKRPSG